MQAQQSPNEIFLQCHGILKAVLLQGQAPTCAGFHCATSPESSPNTSLTCQDSQDAASGNLGSPGVTAGTNAAAANRQPGVFVAANFAKSRAATGAKSQGADRQQRDSLPLFWGVHLGKAPKEYLGKMPQARTCGCRAAAGRIRIL